MDRRLTELHRALAHEIERLIVRAGTGRDDKGQAIIPKSRAKLDALQDAIWEQAIKPFYIGAGVTALRGPVPQSPYARHIVDGIAGATRISAEQQAALTRRAIGDETVLQWLTGPRPFADVREMAPARMSGRITELTLQPSRAALAGLRGPTGRIDMGRARRALVRPKGTYDAFHRFVDPNGHRLSDRVWTTAVDVRSNIDALLDYHVRAGTAAVDIAGLMEPYLTPGGRLSRTQTPYGREGSYAARRLARTEITAAAGRATVNASVANPFVSGVQWRLSGSHRDLDECDMNANGGPNGDGIYPPDQVPRYPNHPHELCTLVPVAGGDTAELVASLRADIQAARGNLIAAASGGNAVRAEALRGLLNPDYLTRAIMGGSLEDAILAAIAAL